MGHDNVDLHHLYRIELELVDLIRSSGSHSTKKIKEAFESKGNTIDAYVSGLTEKERKRFEEVKSRLNRSQEASHRDKHH